MFFRALLEVLRRGEPRGRDALSLEEIGDRVKDLIAERYPHEHARPEVHSPDQREGDIADVPIFPNVAVRARRLAEQISDLAKRLDLWTSAKLLERLERLERRDAELTTLNETVAQVGARIDRIEVLQVELRSEGSPRPTAVSYRGATVGWGLTNEAWHSIPSEVRQSLYVWSNARRVGMFWVFFVSLISCFGVMGIFIHSFPLAPLYLLIMVLALTSVLDLFGRRFRSVLVGSLSSPGGSSEPWEGLDPVLEMRSATITPLLGLLPLRIATPWSDVASLISIVTAILLTGVRFSNLFPLFPY